MNSRETTSLSTIRCQKCSQSNDAQSHFCRYCGERLVAFRQENYDQNQPRPYSWKTDEFQTQSETRPVAQQLKHTAQPQMMQAQPLVTTGLRLDYRGPQDLAGHYRCPYCATSYLPIMERRISTAGWVTFGVLLVLTFVFFWIGLLIKEDVAVCPVCRRQVA